ncbi:MAG: aspartate aminotransferase family protein [Acidobacteriota bacterium]|nr:aspartate aminotransferase family protein [Acidobacteriota bacterium]
MAQENQTVGTRYVLEKHHKHLFPAVKNYYENPLVADHGDGAYVFDLEGKRYLDFFGGILTVSVGHANPEVTRRVTAQMGRLTHLSTLYPNVPIVELAEKLARITPGKLDKCFFTASGSEADETAVMMAQTYTGNQELIALRHGYSGRSTLGQTLTAHGSWRVIPTQIAAVKHGLAPYCYRCPLKQTYPGCGVACARDLDELIATTTTGRVAGMLAEPIQGVGGFITPPREYFEIAAEIIRKHGGVFISDEVQTGFGRTGTMWGIEQYGVEPDMMTMAKGIANGLPLGALVATSDIADTLTKNSLSTFGGNPVSCESANAVIDIVEKEDVPRNARELGAQLREGLEKLQRAHPAVIGDVRGMGLMQAVEFVVDETAGDRTPNPQATQAFLEETRKRGLLVGRGGLYGNVARIAPMLNSTREEIEEGLAAMAGALQAMTQ